MVGAIAKFEMSLRVTLNNTSGITIKIVYNQIVGFFRWKSAAFFFYSYVFNIIIVVDFYHLKNSLTFIYIFWHVQAVYVKSNVVGFAQHYIFSLIRI